MESIEIEDLVNGTATEWAEKNLLSFMIGLPGPAGAEVFTIRPGGPIPTAMTHWQRKLLKTVLWDVMGQLGSNE